MQFIEMIFSVIFYLIQIRMCFEAVFTNLEHAGGNVGAMIGNAFIIGEQIREHESHFNGALVIL